MKAPVLCLDCHEACMDLDLNKDHQHLVCPSCEMVWCAICIGRFEVKVSPKWLEGQSPEKRRAKAHLN